MSTTAVPAVEGWFTTDAEPRLLGTRCTTCGTVFFPRASGFCRNPECRGREFDEVELSPDRARCGATPMPSTSRRRRTSRPATTTSPSRSPPWSWPRSRS